VSNEIEFYQKTTGNICKGTNDYLFVMNNKVYRDNMKTFESQCAVIGFDDCIEEFSHIGWRVKNKLDKRTKED